MQAHSRPRTAGCAWGWGNFLFTGCATFLLWFVSCLANLCLWPQMSLDERIWMTESTQITTPKKTVLNLSSVRGESRWYTQNREGQKTRERRGRDTLPGYKFGKCSLWAFLLARMAADENETSTK